MKYLARFHTGESSSYMMDIFLQEGGFYDKEEQPLGKRLTLHAAVTNEIERNKGIIKVEFFQGIPNSTWTKP